MDIGESIVGAYLRQIRGCDLVLYNERASQQAELDVIGIKKGAVDQVWLCEVATHLEGLQYGNAEQNRKKVSAKVAAAKAYAAKVFRADEHIFELWTPKVSLGKNTDWMNEMTASEAEAGFRVDFIYNERYTSAVQELIDRAGQATSGTSEPAFRLLQILTHLKGDIRI